MNGLNDTTVQPFIGYLWRRDRFYLHGFWRLDAPTSVRDVTMAYNDLGIGYYVYRNPDPNGFLMALVPTFEVHVNDPLTHRDYNNPLDITGTADIVNLTYGLNAVIGQSSVFTFGVVTPVTGPRPFDYEIVALINFRFGRSRRPRPRRADYRWLTGPERSDSMSLPGPRVDPASHLSPGADSQVQ